MIRKTGGCIFIVRTGHVLLLRASQQVIASPVSRIQHLFFIFSRRRRPLPARRTRAARPHRCNPPVLFCSPPVHAWRTPPAGEKRKVRHKRILPRDFSRSRPAIRFRPASGQMPGRAGARAFWARIVTGPAIRLTGARHGPGPAKMHSLNGENRLDDYNSGPVYSPCIQCQAEGIGWHRKSPKNRTAKANDCAALT